MSMLYYHAEALHYAVIGTPNKHEQEQGFFVKYGDGAGDVMPIGNLYKTQVYQLAEYLGVPKEIIDRTPTTDTYSAEQTQEEFFYQLPFTLMDRFWYGFENGYPAEEVADVMGETTKSGLKRYSETLNENGKQLNTSECLRSETTMEYSIFIVHPFQLVYNPSLKLTGNGQPFNPSSASWRINLSTSHHERN